MATGTIAEFDENGGFGLIEDDDRKLLVFSMKHVEQPLHDRLANGSRVAFTAVETAIGPRAINLRALLH